jgi:hypothetical protein
LGYSRSFTISCECEDSTSISAKKAIGIFIGIVVNVLVTLGRIDVSIVGIDNPLVLKTDAQETENLDKTVFLDQEGANMCSLQLSNTQAQNG